MKFKNPRQSKSYCCHLSGTNRDTMRGALHPTQSCLQFMLAWRQCYLNFSVYPKLPDLFSIDKHSAFTRNSNQSHVALDFNHSRITAQKICRSMLRFSTLITHFIPLIERRTLTQFAPRGWPEQARMGTKFIVPRALVSSVMAGTVIRKRPCRDRFVFLLGA